MSSAPSSSLFLVSTFHLPCHPSFLFSTLRRNLCLSRSPLLFPLIPYVSLISSCLPSQRSFSYPFPEILKSSLVNQSRSGKFTSLTDRRRCSTLKTAEPQPRVWRLVRWQLFDGESDVNLDLVDKSCQIEMKSFSGKRITTP